MQTKRFSWARLHHALARRRCVQKYVPPYYAVALRALRRRKLRGTPPQPCLGGNLSNLDAVGSKGPGQMMLAAGAVPLPLRCQSVWARSFVLVPWSCSPGGAGTMHIPSGHLTPQGLTHH